MERWGDTAEDRLEPYSVAALDTVENISQLTALERFHQSTRRSPLSSYKMLNATYMTDPTDVVVNCETGKGCPGHESGTQFGTDINSVRLDMPSS